MYIRLQYPGFIIDYDELHRSAHVSVYAPDQQAPFWHLGQSLDSKSGCYAIHSRHYSLVPEEFYDPADQRSYLQHLGMDDTYSTAVCYIPEWKGYLVYSLENAVLGKDSKLKPYSIWQPLLSHAAKVFDLHGETGICAHVTPNQLYLIAGATGSLKFINAFSVREPNDCLYFLLYGAEQMHLPAATIPVWLTGQFIEDSPLFSLLAQYLGGLKPQPSLFSQLPGLEGTERHQYIDLSSFAACVSSVES